MKFSIIEREFIQRWGIFRSLALRKNIGTELPKLRVHFLRGSSSLSSFEVVDQLRSQIVLHGNFPSLQKIFVMGQGADGQFTQRYALTPKVTSQLPEQHFSFLVNPSSYTYLNKQRPASGRENKFRTPNDVDNWNDYEYGLDKLNNFAARLTPGQL